MDSLQDQTAPDEETLRDAYVIQDADAVSLGYVGGYTDGFTVYGPGYGREVASGGMNEVLAAIVADMDREGYWPDVYYVNERGNTDLLRVPSGEIVASWV